MPHRSASRAWALASTALLVVALLPVAGAGVMARSGGAIVFTFDDRCATAMDAASALEARGFRGTFFVTSAQVGLCPATLTDSQIRSLVSRGHDIQSHSVTHPDLATLGDTALRRELGDSQSTLQSVTGKSVRHIAYPYGSSSARVETETARYYASGRLYYKEFDVMPKDVTDPYEIPTIGILSSTTLAEAKGWVDEAARSNVEIILTFHDIRSNPGEYDTTPQMLAGILDHVKARGIPVLTYAQAMGTSSAPPPASGVTIAHGGGNEWWLEAKVSPRPDAVQAMDTGGSWKTMTLRSWGEWAASFHIEPGHQVKVRASHGGTWTESCWFAHPAGGCASSTPTPPPPSSGSFQASFRNARGNEWWVEADVSVSGGTLAGVDARVDGGAWIALSKTSWGSWAKSFHADGTVEFRARATDGQQALSARYPWPP